MLVNVHELHKAAIDQHVLSYLSNPPNAILKLPTFFKAAVYQLGKSTIHM